MNLLFWNYAIKYTDKSYEIKQKRRICNSICTILIIYKISQDSFIMNANGWTYIYQVVSTLLIAYLYVSFNIRFDNEIQSFVTDLGFNDRLSKSLKIYLFFIILGFLFFSYCLEEFTPDIWDGNYKEWLFSSLKVSFCPFLF